MNKNKRNWFPLPGRPDKDLEPLYKDRPKSNVQANPEPEQQNEHPGPETAGTMATGFVKEQSNVVIDMFLNEALKPLQYLLDKFTDDFNVYDISDKIVNHLDLLVTLERYQDIPYLKEKVNYIKPLFKNSLDYLITSIIVSLKKNGVVLQEFKPAIEEIVKKISDYLFQIGLGILTQVPIAGAVPEAIIATGKTISLFTESFQEVFEPSKKLLDHMSESVKEYNEIFNKIDGRARKGLKQVADIKQAADSIRDNINSMPEQLMSSLPATPGTPAPATAAPATAGSSL